MKEVLLCKYGELILKGANKSYFESLLIKEMRTRIKRAGDFDVYYAQSTIYVEPKSDDCDIELALEYAKKVFGIVAINRACMVEKNIDAIKAAAKEYLPQYLTGVRTFKADARRSDKTFPMKSPELMREVGGAVLEAMPRLKVDVNDPEVTVRVEIRERGAYLHAGAVKGAGGMPLGSSGKGLLLLSGGIDSPVAGYMLAKRGVTLEALHFESFPYTSERAKEKVLELEEKLSRVESLEVKEKRDLFIALFNDLRIHKLVCDRLAMPVNDKSIIDLWYTQGMEAIKDDMSEEDLAFINRISEKLNGVGKKK
jgi:thiamine biosynthesis protein ThiI